MLTRESELRIPLILQVMSSFNSMGLLLIISQLWLQHTHSALAPLCVSNVLVALKLEEISMLLGKYNHMEQALRNFSMKLWFVQQIRRTSFQCNTDRQEWKQCLQMDCNARTSFNFQVEDLHLALCRTGILASIWYTTNSCFKGIPYQTGKQRQLLC